MFGWTHDCVYIYNATHLALYIETATDIPRSKDSTGTHRNIQPSCLYMHSNVRYSASPSGVRWHTINSRLRFATATLCNYLRHSSTVFQALQHVCYLFKPDLCSWLLKLMRAYFNMPFDRFSIVDAVIPWPLVFKQFLECLHVHLLS